MARRLHPKRGNHVTDARDRVSGVSAILVSDDAAGNSGRRIRGRAAVVYSTSSARTIRITVTERGFEPSRVIVSLDETVDLVFTRTVEQSCVETIVISIGPYTRIERALALGVSVTVTLVFAFHEPGVLAFACSDGLHTGLIEAR